MRFQTSLKACVVYAGFTLAGLVLFAAPSAQATDSTWTGGTGSWDDASNWSDGIPGISSNAFICNSGNVNVGTSVAGTANYIFVGSYMGSSPGTLNINGGALGAGSGLYIGMGSSAGTVNVSGGTLMADGIYQSGTQVQGSGTLNISGGYVFSSSDVSIAQYTTGVGIVSGGTLYSSNTIHVASFGNGTLTVNGGLVSAKNIAVGEHAGAAGTITVTSGTLSSTGTITLGMEGSGTLNIGNGTTAGVVSAAAVTGGAQSTVAFNHSGDYTFSSAMSGSITVIQAGSGRTILTGSSSYTGLTSVSSGTLAVNGSLASSGSVQVARGAALAGSGTMGNVSVSGIIASGATGADSMLHLASLSLENGASLNVAITGTTAGVDFGQIVVSDAISLSGTLNITSMSGLSLGNVVTIILNSSSAAVSGSFTSVTVSGTQVALVDNKFTVDGKTYEVSYTDNEDDGTTGNDVTITFVPEPTSWALILGGAGFLAWSKRRKNSH